MVCAGTMLIEEYCAMRFMLMFKSDGPVDPNVPACKKNLPEMQKVMGELKAAGTLLWTEGLLPMVNDARLKYAGGKVAIVDGPFAETKELLAGFAIVQVKSKAEAVALAEKFLMIAGEGTSEVVQVQEM